MMELHVRFKNISEDEQKEELKELATQKFEDLNRYFHNGGKDGELTGDCLIEHTGNHPAYRVHVTIQHRVGKIHTFEATEEADKAETAINTARNTLKAQISDKE